MKTLETRLRQIFTLILGLSLLTPLSAFGEDSKSTNQEKPNILIIMSDDVGYSDTGAYGGEIRTPAIDSLAENGRKFTQFYNTSRCCPTRASLMTGLYPHQTGIGHMIFDTPHPGYSETFADDSIMLSEILQEAGYSTYLAGKWHLAPRSPNKEEDIDYWPTRRGFDKFYGIIAGYGSFYNPRSLCRGETLITPENDPEYQPEEYYFTDAITDNALTFLKDHQQESEDNPFFLFLSHTAAHWPLHAPEEEIEAYDGMYDEGYEPIYRERVRRLRELGLIPEVGDIADPVGDWDEVGNKPIEAELMQAYAAMITRMDKGIDRVINYLRDSGQLDNTLIFYLQDNGSNAEDWFGKPTEFDEPIQPMEPDELQRRSVFSGPLQTRDGRPVRTGHDVRPGPADTYTALKENWANVSNAPFREYKHYVHEGGISSPLIVHWPAGLESGDSETLIREPVHVIDLVPTMLEAAGVQQPDTRQGVEVKPIEGISLMPLLTDSGSFNRQEPLFWEHESNRAIRDGKWKLVSIQGEPWELYDLSRDRGEMNDLADTYPNRAAELAAEWYIWAKNSQVFPLGGWIDRKDESTLNLAQGQTLSPHESPDLVNEGFDLQAKVMKGPVKGVIMSQGSKDNGFSLFAKNEKLTLIKRENGKIERVDMGDIPKPPFKIVSSINRKGRAKVGISDRRFYKDFKNGFLEQPEQGLSVGFDPAGSVGDYDSQFPFQGKLGFVIVRSEIFGN